MKQQTVITFDGTEFPKQNCRKIGEFYYSIGDTTVKNSGQCYKIDDTFYRVSSNKIAWNNTTKRYDLIANMVKGYIDEGGIGYFNFDYRTTMYGSDNFVQSEKAIKINNLHFDFYDGRWKPARDVQASKLALGIRGNKPTYQTLATEIYDSSAYPEDTIQTIKNCFTQTINETPSSIFDKYLNSYTMGLEIETDGGYPPENLYYKYGCLPLKDGSIKGVEVTTLKYPPKLNLYKELLTELSKYALCTQNNSLHVNLSGFSNTPKFRVAMYNLYYRLQSEISAFIPIYKRELEYLTTKQGGAKDHCKPLENLRVVYRYPTDKAERAAAIDKSDALIFTMLNEGILNQESNMKTRQHSKQGRPKWEWLNRYYALNMIPLYFGPIESSRLEFRVHHGTVNPYKTLIWLLICTSIVKYVEKYADKILSGTDKICLDDVLADNFLDATQEGEFLMRYITAYIGSNKQDNFEYTVYHRNLYKPFERDNSYKFTIDNLDILNYESKNKRS